MSDPFVSSKGQRRRSTGMYADRDRSRLQMTHATSNFDESDDDNEVPPLNPMRQHGRPPKSFGTQDKIEFARFFNLCDNTSLIPRRLLLIGYENGIQIWDTTNLGEVKEVLNRRIAGPVVFCGMLPTPRNPPSSYARDDYAERRPLIGIMSVLINFFGHFKATNFLTVLRNTTPAIYWCIL